MFGPSFGHNPPPKPVQPAVPLPPVNVPAGPEDGLRQLETERLRELSEAGATVLRLVHCADDATLFINGSGRPCTGWRYLVTGHVKGIYESGFKAWPSSWAWPRDPWEPVTPA